jgi:hypothetical protein
MMFEYTKSDRSKNPEGIIQECSFGRWRSSNEAIFQILMTFIEYRINYDYVEAWT